MGKIITGIILCAIGVAAVLYAGITQQILCFAKYGAVFQKVLIPDISMLGYLGLIPMCIGWCMIVY